MCQTQKKTVICMLSTEWQFVCWKENEQYIFINKWFRTCNIAQHHSILSQQNVIYDTPAARGDSLQAATENIRSNISANHSRSEPNGLSFRTKQNISAWASKLENGWKSDWFPVKFAHTGREHITLFATVRIASLCASSICKIPTSFSPGDKWGLFCFEYRFVGWNERK